MHDVIGPKVSVCVVTYNHQNYIAECLQSLIDQEVDFQYEIIVGDDCSTDETRLIVASFAEKYPSLFRLAFHDRNMGPVANYIAVHNLAKGQYVVHMDGDDYALPRKLAMQSEYLDHHIECSMVFHRCQTLLSNRQFVYSTTNIVEPCNFAEFLWLYPGCSWHSSKMYRKSAIRTNEYKGSELIDRHFHFEHGLSGLVGYINMDLGVYRDGVGVSSSIDNLHPLALDAFNYAKSLGYDKDLIDKNIARYLFSYALQSLERKNYSNFRTHVVLSRKLGNKTFNSEVAYHLRAFPSILRQLYLIRNWLARL